MNKIASETWNTAAYRQSMTGAFKDLFSSLRDVMIGQLRRKLEMETVSPNSDQGPVTYCWITKYL